MTSPRNAGEIGEGIAGPRPDERHPKPDTAHLHFPERCIHRPRKKRHPKKNQMGQRKAHVDDPGDRQRRLRHRKRTMAKHCEGQHPEDGRQRRRAEKIHLRCTRRAAHEEHGCHAAHIRQRLSHVSERLCVLMPADHHQHDRCRAKNSAAGLNDRCRYRDADNPRKNASKQRGSPPVVY